MTTAKHTISYAYPGSPAAAKPDCSRTGCYYVEFEGDSLRPQPFPSLGQSVAFAAAHGSEPTRWSIEHPLNLEFLTKDDRHAVNSALGKAKPPAPRIGLIEEAVAFYRRTPNVTMLNNIRNALAIAEAEIVGARKGSK